MMDNGKTAENKAEDWQVVVIANTYMDEIDCNSGARRRVWLASGKIEPITPPQGKQPILTVGLSCYNHQVFAIVDVLKE